MGKRFRRILSFALTLAMIVAFMPLSNVTVKASVVTCEVDNTTELRGTVTDTWNVGKPESGSTPTDAVKAHIHQNGTVHIFGTGEMIDYGSTELQYAPWHSYAETDVYAVVIDSGVTSVGNNAFQLCTKISSVTFPDSLVRIGNYAFDECNALTSITLPSNLTTIGRNAFVSTKITSLTIPSSVTSIGQAAFGNYSHTLESVTLCGNVTTLHSSAFYNVGSSEQYSQCPTLTLPSGWTGATPTDNMMAGNKSWCGGYFKSVTYSKTKATTPTGITGGAGKVSGLDSSKAYEYSTDGSTWTDVTSGATELTGLSAGTYKVRLKETDTNAASDAVEVTVSSAKPSLSSINFSSVPTKYTVGGTEESPTYTLVNDDGTEATTSNFVVGASDSGKYAVTQFATFNSDSTIYVLMLIHPSAEYQFAASATKSITNATNPYGFLLANDSLLEEAKFLLTDASIGDFAINWKLTEYTPTPSPVHVHDFSGEWTVTKEATATTDGKKETTCKNGCGTKKVEIIPATGTKEDDSSNGKLNKGVEVSKDAPVASAFLDNTKTELMNASGIFSDAEKTAIKNGQDAKVYLQIADKAKTDIAAADQTKMEGAADQALGEKAVIKYMDVSLYKQVGNGEAVAVSNPGTDIEVTIEIPKTLLVDTKGVARKYRILRLHDGKVETISGTFNYETNEFTFSTDKFSTYAIAYSDENMDIVISTPEGNTTLSKLGDTLQLGVTVTPADDANQKVTYTSSNEKVATVDATGKVTAVGNGTATITVTTADGSVTKSITITVNVATTSPKTGDSNSMWIWLMLMVAGLGVSSLTLLRKKEQ